MFSKSNNYLNLANKITEAFRLFQSREVTRDSTKRTKEESEDVSVRSAQKVTRACVHPRR